MHCFMFPGQPLAHEAGLPDNPDFADVSELVQAATGLDLTTFDWRATCAGGQVALQVYGTAMSLYRCRQLRRQGVTPSIVAEHSMGIYPALAAVGSIPEREALELTWRFGRALAGMGERQSYALGCVIGMTMPPVLALAEQHGIHLANQNTSRHFLLAGEQHRIEAAMAAALTGGAFSVRIFPCDAPLHTPLIEAIAPELREIVADYRFAEPAVPLLEHLGQDCLAAADIPGFLVEELCRPVYWEATYRALRRAGATTFTEVGVGDSLKKYNRWIASEHP